MRLDELERLQVLSAERRLAVFRLPMLTVAVLIYVVLEDKQRTHPYLVMGLWAAAWAYAFLLHRRGWLLRLPALVSSAAASLGDAVMGVLFLHATGGPASPFFPILLLSLVTVGLRFTPIQTGLSALVYAIAYLTLWALTGSIEMGELVSRVMFLFVAAGLGASFSREGIVNAVARTQLEERLKAGEARSRLGAIVESSQDAIIGLGLDGTIQSWNRSAERIFGYRPEEVIGRTLQLLHPPEHATESGEVLERIRRGQHLATFESPGITRDGRPIRLSLSLSPVADAIGARVGFSAIIRDITERKRAEEAQLHLAEERAARAAAEDAVRARDDFMSVASHELRTPLTSLKLQVESLLRIRRGTEHPAERIRLERLERQAHRLGRLVENVLDVTQATSHHFELALESVDIAESVREAAARIQSVARAADTPVKLSIQGPVVGLWDAGRLSQVIDNLLSNAIKYGAGQPVEVHLSADEHRAKLVVRDHGIGISPADQRRIFERFERAVSSRHFGGFGLGLWIVRQVVEAMGGTVSVESQAHKGSTFTVLLPRLPDQSAEQRPPPTAPQPESTPPAPASP